MLIFPSESSHTFFFHVQLFQVRLSKPSAQTCRKCRLLLAVKTVSVE